MKESCFKGCFRSKAGFTLIELLVVVLIIGILASVAIPQYQKAVEKTRVSEAVTLMENIITAERVYHLANGEFTRDMDALDLEMPGITANTTGHSLATKDFSFNVSTDALAVSATRRKNINGGGSYVLFMEFDPITGIITRRCGGNIPFCNFLGAEWNADGESNPYSGSSTGVVGD